MDATGALLSANSDNPECPICLNSFTEPKIIFCGHIMCRECLLTWFKERGMEAGCPLCRHPIFEVQFPNLPVDLLAQLVVDSLPTDQVMKATARGKIILTPEMCPGCEDLLCSSRSSPHPKCPGPQDTHKYEADSRHIIKDLSDKIQMMLKFITDIQKVLKDMEEGFRGVKDVSESVALLQDQALRFVGWFQSQTSVHYSVLLTHQHILERIQDSGQVVAIILMKEPMQDRVEFIRKKLEIFNQIYLNDSQSLRASWRKV